MAIVNMKKFNLLVLQSHREELLRELQLFRSVQFEDVKEVAEFDEELLSRFKTIDFDDTISSYDEKLNKCTYAIDLISKYSPSVSGIKGLIRGLPNFTFEEMEKRISEIDFEKDYEEVKLLGDDLSRAESKISKRKEMIKELQPISNLDISFDELEHLKRFDGVVGGVSEKVLEPFLDEMKKMEYTYYEEFGQNKDEHLFFVVSDKRETEELNEAFRAGNFNKLKFDSDDLPMKKIEALTSEVKEIEIEKASIEQKIAEKAELADDFKLMYDYIGNLKVRESAQKDFMTTASICMISGYLPDFEVKRFEQSVEKISGEVYSIEYEDAERDSDDVPILLKNNRFVRIFEGITSTYALPKYNEIDPTPLYAPIYAFFFGMMSADFGYGVVLLLLTTLGLKFCNFTPDMRKNVRFFQLLGVSTTIWGFLYGSYFGASIPGMWKLLDLGTQFMTVLVISIAIGGIHLAYALAIKGYMQIRDGQYVDMFFDVIAWYITLAGIILFLLSTMGVVNPALSNIFKYCMIIGIVLLVIGGARGAEGNIAVRLVAGLYNVYGISSYIGDFVSYSRLMALGMSGGYIAFSVNMIAGMMWGSPVGMVAAIFILVFFHAFNLFLSCLGAYVHALRLIYVEFFGKFYEGGGKAFRFFRNKTKYINLDRHYED